MNLQEIVAQKCHHGAGCFRNPFYDKPHGRLREVFEWKLLPRNYFRAQYQHERVTPVALDWQSGKDYPELGAKQLLVVHWGTFRLVDLPPGRTYYFPQR